ncbi:hypothetical protein BD309DRAFT_618792 [Dichomitus squalens]|uniref:Uncharacterized protein n=1 Tax=Dichomitus squalens TaxID=114155 RepID=A0A4Q9QCF5_9APHY|nr:hypothetical protein BD309DRAFT_618792 [Dichomitus squalens]TBU65305.1 hypothetical protein BD310DRAFT_2385 [Dichomitus squalens]
MGRTWGRAHCQARRGRRTRRLPRQRLVVVVVKCRVVAVSSSKPGLPRRLSALPLRIPSSSLLAALTPTSLTGHLDLVCPRLSLYVLDYSANKLHGIHTAHLLDDAGLLSTRQPGTRGPSKHSSPGYIATQHLLNKTNDPSQQAFNLGRNSIVGDPYLQAKSTSLMHEYVS